MTDEILKMLSDFKPLSEVYFGHTKTQIERFKVPHSSSRKMEYWYHLRQLQSLQSSLQDLHLQGEELLCELESLQSWWPFWNKRLRSIKAQRVELKRLELDRLKREKENEALTTLNFINESYSDLLELKTHELLAEEEIYWAERLSKQLGISLLARQLGVSEGDLSATLSLPPAPRAEVALRLKSFLAEGNAILNGTPEVKLVE